MDRTRKNRNRRGKGSRSRSRSRNKNGFSNGENIAHVNTSRFQRKPYNSAVPNATKRQTFHDLLRRYNRISPPDLDKWFTFYKSILSTPIYLIECHASMCVSASCEWEPTFHLPAKTILMNLTHGGEYCTTGYHGAQIAKIHFSEIQKYAVASSSEDITIMHPDAPFLSELSRATNCEYPNFECTFHDTSKKRMLTGVFDLKKTPYDGFVYENNLLTDLDHDEKWSLKEVIKHRYKTSGISKGIFIFTGCTSESSENISNRGDLTRFNDLRDLIRIENLKYSMQLPTLPISLIRRKYPAFEILDKGMRSYEFVNSDDRLVRIPPQHRKVRHPSALAMAEEAFQLEIPFETAFPTPAAEEYVGQFKIYERAKIMYDKLVANAETDKKNKAKLLEQEKYKKEFPQFF